MSDGSAPDSSRAGSPGSRGEMATRSPGQSPLPTNVVVGGFSPGSPHVRADAVKSELIKLEKVAESPSIGPNAPQGAHAIDGPRSAADGAGGSKATPSEKQTSGIEEPTPVPNLMDQDPSD